MTTNKLVWKIGSEAGHGIAIAGTIFSKTCARGGLNVLALTEYESLIRGGHNAMTIRVDEKPVLSASTKIDILVALNLQTLQLYENHVNPGGIIIYDIKIKIDKPRKDVTYEAIECEDKLFRNTMALGATFGVLKYDFDLLESVIKDSFHDPEIIKKNISSAKKGYERANKIQTKYELKPVKNAKLTLLDGNQAISLGAIKAGLKFFAAYPMTPASGILHTLAQTQIKTGMLVIQPEDEIAAANMAIGASYAGVPAMTATSGGGFALMTETISLSGMSEVPLTVVLAMRPAPATGMPTWTEQGDLQFAINSGHGDFPRAVIAPGDNEEAFYEAANALNIAEKYQMPVILITDKYLSESPRTVELDSDKIKLLLGKIETNPPSLELKTRYKRYLITKDGISPRTIPGTKNGLLISTSDEHDEYGQISENNTNRVKMMQKRMRKMETLLTEWPEPKIYGPKNSKITIVCWGSTKGPAIEAAEQLGANCIHFSYIYPMHPNAKKILSEAKKLVLVESNYTGQFGKLIAQETGILIDKKILKYDGTNFTSEELVQRINEELK